MKVPVILILLILLTIIIIIAFYYWYIRHDDNNKYIPLHLLYQPEKTFTDIFENISTKYDNCPALKYKKNNEWNTITYYEYYKTCCTFSQKLLYFTGPHPRVAILSNNRPEWFYVHIGTFLANGISIGIYPTSNPDNCLHIINHSCVELMVVENINQLLKLYELKFPTIRMIITFEKIGDTDELEKELINNIKSNNPQLQIMYYDTFMKSPICNGNINTIIETHKPQLDDIATIIYTSGYTGTPKGVVITHNNIMASIKSIFYVMQTKSNIELGVQEKSISYLPLNHIATQMMDIYLPIISVGLVHFVDSNIMINSITDALQEIRPTIFIGIPSVWNKIKEKIQEHGSPNKFLNIIVNKFILRNIGLDSVKYCITTGAPIDADTIKFYDTLGLELCNVYGMSETTGITSVSVPGCSDGVGTPVLDIKIDPKTSEIMVKGDAVFKEYFKNKKETDDSLKKNWFKTGDMGYIDRSGSLHITGRIKDMIITSTGENIYQCPIENTLLQNINIRKNIVDHVILVGDNRNFLSVILITNNKYQSCNEHLIKKAIDDTNATAPNIASNIKKYLIITDHFDTNEYLSLTSTLKRNKIIELYIDKINDLYAE